MVLTEKLQESHILLKGYFYRINVVSTVLYPVVDSLPEPSLKMPSHMKCIAKIFMRFDCTA